MRSLLGVIVSFQEILDNTSAGITMILRVITITYARITMISERMTMTGEILIDWSDKLFKIDSNLVMIRRVQVVTQRS